MGRSPLQGFPAGLPSVQDEEAFIERLRRREPDAERQLVAQLREDLRRGGGERGLVLLQHAFRSRIVGWLQRDKLNGDLQLAEEAWNDTLYRVWTRIEQYDEARSRFLTWVWNQARYAALDLRRRPLVGREIPFAGETRASDADEREEEPDLLAKGLEAEAQRAFDESQPPSSTEERAIRRAIDQLSEEEQWLLRLRYVHGFRNVDIARRGLAGRPLPEEHVRVYVNRAAKRLRRYYDEELGRAGAKEGGATQ